MDSGTFGDALRRWRTTRQLSLRQLATKAHCGKSLICDLENGASRARPDIARQLDLALETGGELEILANQEQQARSSSTVRPVPSKVHHYTNLITQLLTAGEGDADTVKRRTMIAGLGTAAIAPGLALEATRHGLTLSLAEQHAQATVDEWDEIVHDYGHSYLTEPPEELQRSLMIDMLALQAATQQRPEEATLRQLRRCGAMLAAFMAMTVGNLGQLQPAQRWWRSARRTADDSGHLRTILWVRGREVIRALYEPRPIGLILRLADHATARAADAGPADLPELACGHAQALALAGRATEAQQALRRAWKVYEALPDRTLTDRGSLFGWHEGCLRFTESFVYSHLGDLQKADAAQSRAIAVYPAGHRRGLAEIELQRALCMVRAGDVTEGTRHARRTLSALPAEDHIRTIVALANEVLTAVPAAQRDHPAVHELQDLLIPSTARS